MKNALLREFILTNQVAAGASGGVLADVKDTYVVGSLSGRPKDRKSRPSNTAHLFLHVSKMIGATLDVDVLASINGVESHVGSFAQLTAVGAKQLLIEDCPALLYAKWVLPGAVAEVTDVQCVADVAGSLNSTFFLIDTTTVKFYVWMDVNSAGVDPNVTGRTGITVALATNETANATAVLVEAAIEATTGFSSTVSTDTVTVTNDVAGAVDDAVDGSALTGFTISVTTQGSPDVDFKVAGSRSVL